MRFVLLILWCLRWLPPAWVAALGNGLGGLLFHWGRKRVTLLNLQACFPEKTDEERERIGRGVFRNLARSTLELGRLWYAPVEVALANVKLVDRHLMDEWAGQVPIIVLAPHFVGLDIGGARFSREYPNAFSMYSAQKNKVFDRALRRSRQRYSDATLITRQQGLRPVLKALKEKRPFYYLPDMDYGERDTIFVPFFGVDAATITGVSRLARLAGARVLPCITRMLPGGEGYVVRFLPAWENYPGASIEADTRRMNAFVEEQVRQMPEQYLWVHKRFKTRPPGEAPWY